MNINNKHTKQVLEVIFNKSFEDISDVDLQQLEKINVNSQGLDSIKVEEDISEIVSKCGSLKSLLLRKTIITPTIIELINRLELDSLYLDECAFEVEESIKLPPSLHTLDMQKCFLDDYSHLLETLPINIETLSIVSPADEEEILGEKLNRLINLKNLTIQNCIFNFRNTYLKACTYIQMLNTTLTDEDLDIIESFPSLEEIVLSDVFLNLDGIAKLKKKCKIKTNLIDFNLSIDDV